MWVRNWRDFLVGGGEFDFRGGVGEGEIVGGGLSIFKVFVGRGLWYIWVVVGRL